MQASDDFLTYIVSRRHAQSKWALRLDLLLYMTRTASNVPHPLQSPLCVLINCDTTTINVSNWSAILMISNVLNVISEVMFFVFRASSSLFVLYESLMFLLKRTLLDFSFNTFNVLHSNTIDTFHGMRT